MNTHLYDIHVQTMNEEAAYMLVSSKTFKELKSWKRRNEEEDTNEKRGNFEWGTFQFLGFGFLLASFFLIPYNRSLRRFDELHCISYMYLVFSVFNFIFHFLFIFAHCFFVNFVLFHACRMWCEVTSGSCNTKLYVFHHSMHV